MSKSSSFLFSVPVWPKSRGTDTSTPAGNNEPRNVSIFAGTAFTASMTFAPGRFAEPQDNSLLIAGTFAAITARSAARTEPGKVPR